MTFEVELRRVGSSRISIRSIPLTARIIQGGKRGEDLLAGRSIRDLEYAKQTVREILEMKFAGLEINVRCFDLTEYHGG